MTRTLGGDLARALASGEVGRLRERYAPGATLEAHLPGGSIEAAGREDVLEELAGRLSTAAPVRVLGERRSRGGSVLRLESSGDGPERRRHLLQTRRGRVVHHVVYPERAPASQLPPLPDGIDGVRSRTALEPGISGCLVERWRLDDGRVVFAKHLRPVDSWLMRASGDRGREAELLAAGDLDRVAEAVDHAVLRAVSEPGGWLLVSDDRSAVLARPPGTATDRRELLRAIGEVHRRFHGRAVPAAGSLEERLRVFSPTTARREVDGSDLAPKVIGRGWELFREVAPADVVAGVDALLERPEPLVRALRGLPGTLVHGDLRPANVGIGARLPVVVDWGLALAAPPAFDGAWWLFNSGWRSAAALDRRLEEAVAATDGNRGLELCLLATLVQSGCYFGFEAVQSPDPAARRRAREGLAWWAARARAGLDGL